MNIAEPYNVVEYTLYSANYSLEPVIIEEPIGWKTDLMELKKSDKNYTTVQKFSSNLEFHGLGANFITEAYKQYGLEEKVILTKRIIHPTKQEVLIRYAGFLDGYTYERKGGRVKISIVESDLQGDINGYKSEEVEITRATSLTGVELPEMKSVRANIRGKNLLLVSKWGIRDTDKSYVIDHNGDNEVTYCTFPQDNFAESHIAGADVTNYLINNRGDYDLPADGSTQNMMMSVQPEDIVCDLTIDVDIIATTPIINRDMDRWTGELYLIKFEDKSSEGKSQYVYKSRILLATSFNPDGSESDRDQVRNQITYSGFFEDYPILKGESIALAVLSKSRDANDIELTFEKIDNQLVSKEFEEGSQIDVYQPFEYFERLIQIMTGRTDRVLVSNFLGRTDLGYEEDGEGANMCLTSGFVARGFKDKPLQTNWTKAIESFSAIWNLSWNVEKEGFKEYVRIEPADFFFNGNRTVLERRVPASGIKIKVSEAQSYSGVELGYVKGGDNYEEVDSLDEFNGKITWGTPLAKAQKKYTKLSEYRADVVGLLFALRKPVKFFATEDTAYDKDIFVLDLKKAPVGEVLEQRVWQDDFSTAPIGIYDPNNATNLRFQPWLMFKRHQEYIKASLGTYNNSFVTFGSVIGNANITLDGVNIKDPISILDMGTPRFQNVSIEFEYDTDFDLEQSISDNIYGIFEFKDTDGLTWQLRLFEFKKDKYKGLVINGIQ